MFQLSSNLHHLALGCEDLSFSKPITAVLRVLLHPGSPLDRLTLHGGVSGGIISAVMDALKVNSTLQTLDLGGLSADEINAEGGAVLLALENGLPGVIGIRELIIPSHLLDEAQGLRLVQAIKRNHSIQTFNYDGVEAFSDASKSKLSFYLERNKKLPALLECPSKVPLSAWPKIFEISQQCEYGATSVFRGLLGLVGLSAVGEKTQSSRKRLHSNDDSGKMSEEPHPIRQRKE